MTNQLCVFGIPVSREGIVLAIFFSIKRDPHDIPFDLQSNIFSKTIVFSQIYGKLNLKMRNPFGKNIYLIAYRTAAARSYLKL